MQNGVTGDVGGAAIYMTGATSVYISYCTFMNNLVRAAPPPRRTARGPDRPLTQTTAATGHGGCGGRRRRRMLQQ